MLIDWFTVGAQLVNFLVLVFLLQRFLYKPILKAIAVREKKISDELTDAAAKKEEALKDKMEFETKNRDFDRDRAALLIKAQDEPALKKRDCFRRLIRRPTLWRPREPSPSRMTRGISLTKLDGGLSKRFSPWPGRRWPILPALRWKTLWSRLSRSNSKPWLPRTRN